MPAAVNVSPSDWSGTSVVYDDGSYSVIWGHYKNDISKVVGVRWNGEGDTLGFPNAFGNPIWHVEPRMLSEVILLGVLEKVLASGGGLEIYVSSLLDALREAKRQTAYSA